MVDSQDPEYVREVLLRSLNAAPRTRAQLVTTLLRKGIEPQIYEPVLDRFTEVGLIDDLAYARMWLSTASERNPKSPRLLRMELRRKGVREDDIDEALSTFNQHDGEEFARAFATRKAQQLAQQPTQVIVRKIAAALGRKGYSAEVCWRLATEVTRHDPEM